MAKSSPILIAVSLLAAWAVWADTSPPNIDKALQAQYQLVSERPQDAMAHNDLGNLLSLTGSLGEAEAAYQRAKELDSVDTSIRFNLGLMLQQAGRLEDANQEYYSLLELEPKNAWAHYQLGVVAFDQGKSKLARELYARSFALDPTLSFPRHNPHMIDNPLATEALLMSSRYLSDPAARVPRQYAEAGRIADLMLEEEPSKDTARETNSEEEMDAEAEEEDDLGEEPPQPSRDLLIENEEGASRVLTDEDLEGLSPVGQAGKRNARRGSRDKGRNASRYNSGRSRDTVKRDHGSQEQDSRSRYRPRSTESRNRALERGSEQGFTTMGRAGGVGSGQGVGSEEDGNAQRPRAARPAPSRPAPGRLTPSRPGSGGGSSGSSSDDDDVFRPGTGSTASLRLELLDEAVGP